MLTVAKITSGSAQGYADYLEGRSRPTSMGDYYLKDGDRVEAPGRWAAGADAVGMRRDAAVTGEQLRALMDVRRPDTGAELRRAGATGQVAAIDATFSAPKSVSAIWAVGGTELRGRIEQAQERAVDRALAYSLRHVAMIRQRTADGEVRHGRPQQLIATSWRHTTARAVAGQPSDPQLHSHVLLHAAVRRDGRVVAIDSRAWFVHRRELGAAYRSELARELHQMGYEIRRGTGRAGRYFEIAGVPQELLDRWSSRHRQIRDAIDREIEDRTARLTAEALVGGPTGERAAASLRQLHETGQLSPAQDRLLRVSTRSAKQPLSSHADLDKTWRQTAEQRGLTPSNAVTDRQQQPAIALAPGVGLLGRLTDFDATFPARDARAAALELSPGSSIEDALQPLRAQFQTGELVEHVGGTYSTRQHREVEQATVTAVKDLTTERIAPLDPDTVTQEVARLRDRLQLEGHALTPEQAAAIHLACADHQLVVIEGQAGTGKSTVLSAVARAHQAEGRDVIVTSTAALAAHRLAGEFAQDDVRCDAFSIAGLHAAVRSGRLALDQHTTVIHDEAALASTREQHQLLTAVREAGSRVIEVGDPKQSQPVGAGGLWPEIQAAADTAEARRALTRNVRGLHVDDRRDQARFRDGEIGEALVGYRDRKRVHLGSDPRLVTAAALRAAEDDRLDGRRTLVIAQTSNEELDALNARAQSLRRESGEVTGPGIEVPARPYSLRTGDEVQIRHTLRHPDRDQPVYNGTTARIAAVDANQARLKLELTGGENLTLTADQVADGDLRLAYVQHPFPAQGATTDTAHLIVGDHVTREGAYVGLTRARAQTTIYATDSSTKFVDGDPLMRLTQRLSRNEPDVPSIHLPLAHEAHIDDQAFDTQQPPDHSRESTEPATSSESGRAPDYLTRALGLPPSPQDPTRPAWDHAAELIGDYRTKHGITDTEPPLGPEPPIGQFTRRRQYRQAQHAITQATRNWRDTAPAMDATRSDPEPSRRSEPPGYEP